MAISQPTPDKSVTKGLGLSFVPLPNDIQLKVHLHFTTIARQALHLNTSYSNCKLPINCKA